MNRTRITIILLLVSGGSFLIGVFAAKKNLPAVTLLVETYRSLANIVEEQPRDRHSGPRFRVADSPERREITSEQLDQIEKLRALGYMQGSLPAPATSGVTKHNTARAYGGFNLLSDGRAPEAQLMDMTGTVLHTWAYRFEAAFPDSDAPSDATGTEYFRRVALLPDGALLAIFEGQGLIKIDRDSHLIWAYPGKAHHDLEIRDDGTIVVLVREIEILPRVNSDSPVMHDLVVRLSSDGQEIDRYSILEAIEQSNFSGLLDLTKKRGDLFHTNTVETIEDQVHSTIPPFAPGSFMISLRTINTIAVLDPRSRHIVWAMSGMWRRQHQPTLLDDGRLIVFDNRGSQGRSRVIEFDASTQMTHWQFNDGGNLFSPTCGSVQRLPNGNTLITESDRGRAIEVTPNGKVVWEYLTPHRTGAKNELIATLFEVIRLDPKLDLSWTEPHGS